MAIPLSCIPVQDSTSRLLTSRAFRMGCCALSTSLVKSMFSVLLVCRELLVLIQKQLSYRLTNSYRMAMEAHLLLVQRLQTIVSLLVYHRLLLIGSLMTISLAMA